MMNDASGHYPNSISVGVMQVELLKNRLGFDDAFNYKEELDLNAALNRSGILKMILLRADLTYL